MWDVFISHASEDKEGLVRELVLSLSNQNIKVWYDEFSLKLGDSLRRSIDYGLSNSRFGIVILSPYFFSKEWPQSELDALFTLEKDQGKKILPVWHNISKEEVMHHSPLLASKLAVVSNTGIMNITDTIITAIKDNVKENNIDYDIIKKNININLNSYPIYKENQDGLLFSTISLFSVFMIAFGIKFIHRSTGLIFLVFGFLSLIGSIVVTISSLLVMKVFDSDLELLQKVQYENNHDTNIFPIIFRRRTSKIWQIAVKNRKYKTALILRAIGLLMFILLGIAMFISLCLAAFQIL